MLTDSERRKRHCVRRIFQRSGFGEEKSTFVWAVLTGFQSLEIFFELHRDVVGGRNLQILFVYVFQQNS